MQRTNEIELMSLLGIRPQESDECVVFTMVMGLCFGLRDTSKIPNLEFQKLLHFGPKILDFMWCITKFDRILLP